jgi:hypothetical protein
LRTLDPSEICTSLAPGFYLRDQEEFEEWLKYLKDMKARFKDQFIFSIFDKKPQMFNEENFNYDSD